MDLLKIGVIGTGHMGCNHVRNISDDKRFDLIGIYDVDFERASELAETYGTKAFKSMDELLSKVEAVVVAHDGLREAVRVGGENDGRRLVERLDEEGRHRRGRQRHHGHRCQQLPPAAEKPHRGGVVVGIAQRSVLFLHLSVCFNGQKASL